MNTWIFAYSHHQHHKKIENPNLLSHKKQYTVYISEKKSLTNIINPVLVRSLFTVTIFITTFITGFGNLRTPFRLRRFEQSHSSRHCRELICIKKILMI